MRKQASGDLRKRRRFPPEQSKIRNKVRDAGIARSCHLPERNRLMKPFPGCGFYRFIVVNANLIIFESWLFTTCPSLFQNNRNMETKNSSLSPQLQRALHAIDAAIAE